MLAITYLLKYFKVQTWVSQDSKPICAASALAGALNALFNQKRSSAESLDGLDILTLYRHTYKEKVSQKLQSFERHIEENSALSILQPLSSYLRVSLSTTYASEERQSATGRSKTTLDINLIRNWTNELLRNPNANTSEEVKKELSRLISSGNTKDINESEIKVWDWEGDILKLLKAIKGYNSLCLVEKPSTAPIGNSEFISAATRITDSISSVNGERVDLHTVFLMGKRGSSRTKIEIPITREDDDDDDGFNNVLRDQWNQLK